MLEAILRELNDAQHHDPRTLQRQDVPAQPGIYVWYSKQTKNPVYVGKAAGKAGLRKRIWAQHLNPGYLEGRSARLRDADAFQLARSVEAHGERRIDKSVLRRNIGRRESVAPGQATVDFIRDRLEVAWIVLPSSQIVQVERQLISAFAAQHALYNLSGLRPAPAGASSRDAGRRTSQSSGPA